MNILIAEDDRHLGEGISDLLQNEGYNCILTRNGAEALTQYNSNRPDICIFDIMMPEMDGYELCRQIRSRDETIPIILLTAKADEIDQVIGLELGADDYITKPFGSRELVARLKALLRRASLKQATSPTGKTTPFKLGHLTIDPSTMRGMLSSDLTDSDLIEHPSFTLTLRELKVLEMLYENKGAVLSKQTIFEECWGRRYMTNSRALDQFISQLRQKIEQDHTNPKIIQTVHGVGYRYEE